MKLGYLTQYSKQEVQQAADIGFDALECHARSWPIHETRSKSKLADIAKEVQEETEALGIEITAIANYDVSILTQQTRSAVAALKRVINFTAQLGVPVMTAMAGRIPDKPIEDSIKQFKKVWGKAAKMADDAGIKIAFENWPGLGGYPITGKNIAYCPAYWDMMFEAVPDQSIGIEYDPSHLYWLGIDHVDTIIPYADRIYHVHAKDTEILNEQVSRTGIMEARWYRYRIPGFGDVDWHNFFSTLYENGFNGGVAIEHEDPVFSGDKRVEGFKLGYNFLKPMMPL